MTDSTLSGTLVSRDAPARFEEPWHAGLFAITLDLSDKGHFTWSEWTATFGASLKLAASQGRPSDGSNYFDVWLETLENMLMDRQMVTADRLASIKAEWTSAYLNTPHGHPVNLDR